jgi:hypothetical protein
MSIWNQVASRGNTHEEVMVAFRNSANMLKNIANLWITHENNLGYK